MSERKPIGYVEATVRFPLYEGDSLGRESWNDFVYDEPGITKDGRLATCRRDCVTVTSREVLEPTP